MRKYAQYSKRHRNRTKDRRRVSLYASWVYGKPVEHFGIEESVSRFLAQQARSGK